MAHKPLCGGPGDNCERWSRCERKAALVATEKNDFTVYRLAYPSPLVTLFPQNNTVPAEYYLPHSIAPDGPKRPAAQPANVIGVWPMQLLSP